MILRLLIDQPKHGYELRQDLTVFRYFYPLNNINVYPILKELADKGYVSSHDEIVDSRHRKIYRITPQGEAELDRWLEIVPEDCIPLVTDLVSLKLLLAPKDKTAQLRWLSQSLAQLDEEIAAWRDYLRDHGSRLNPLAQVSAEYRVESFEQRRDHLKRVLEMVLSGESRGEDDKRRRKRPVAGGSGEPVA
jgi:DNA-binding PadR family transcriptional regulator